MDNLTPQQRLEIDHLLASEDVKKAENDLLYFLKRVKTWDEHDQVNPTKPLPDKPYLEELALLFLTEPLLAIEKSRQMMVTWLMCACHLWDAWAHQGRRIFFQSKKEKDANANIDRVKFIYENLPPHYKIAHPANMPMTYLKLEFGKQKSIIEGIPQGADVLRQYTCSRIFSDETAFQEQAEKAWEAAKPTITGGGSIVMVSSPNFKEHFWRICQDCL